MMAELVQHLWQSTIFAAAAALVAVWLRGHRARVRYGVWLAASLKLLAPFAVLVSLGAKLGWRVAPGPVGVMAQGMGQAFALNWSAASPAVRGAVAAEGGWGIGWLLAAFWVGGSALILGRWILQWRRIAAVVRGATPLSVRDGIGIAVSDTLLEPGVFGIWRPSIVLPRGVAERLNRGELEAVIAHEVCHVRRHDNLAAAVHMVVESLFWFHPLVWWLGARLVEERERACDEAVLELGGEPQVYAESIVKVCQFYLESPLACVAGVTGSDLKKRMERIMSKQMGSNLTAWRKAVLTGLSAAAVLAPVAVGLMNAPAGRAQGGEGVTGMWTGTMGGIGEDGKPRSGPVALNLRQNGSVITGTASGPQGTDPFETGRIEGDRVTLQTGPFKIELHLQGGRLRGTGTLDAGGGAAGMTLQLDLTKALTLPSSQDLEGLWAGQLRIVSEPPSTAPFRFYLRQNGNQVTGSVGRDEKRQTPIANARIEGDRLRFETGAGENQFSGKFDLGLNDGRLAGDFSGNDHGSPLRAKLELTWLGKERVAR
jgi:beta-lactamase regulating signal transducer with metallopeptidase domain